MNVELLRKIQVKIKEKPELFDMRCFAICGTAHCIAGWALRLSAEMPRSYNLEWAASILGVAYGPPMCSSDRLFFTGFWPEIFRSEYRAAFLRKDHAAAVAEIACRRIDHFIATEGRE